MAEKRLTKEIAKHFLATRHPDLTSFTELDDDVVEETVFWAFKGGLDLNGLTSLSEASAEALGRRGSLYRNFDGLTSLSDAVAANLGKGEMYELSLNGLAELSDVAAASLGKHKGTLWLNGLTSLSDAAVWSFITHRRGSLYLNGVTSLWDAATESLSQCTGSLYLNGLTSLSDSAARSLAKFEGVRLSLTLEKLPASAADILRRSFQRFPGRFVGKPANE